LRFARAAAPEHEQFLGDAELVVNDHYDTDGFASLLAVLRPELAFAPRSCWLAAAATGDYGTWQTWRGFRDRSRRRAPRERGLARARAFFGVDDPEQLSLRRYAWLLEHADLGARSPGQFAPLYAEEMRAYRTRSRAASRGDLERRSFAPLGFSVLTSRGARHRMTLNTLAANYRVLHVQHDADGTRYRHHDRTESWFDLVTIPAAAARRPASARGAARGASSPSTTAHRGRRTIPGEPIPELYFGVPSRQAYGQLTRELRPSRLPAERVVALFVEYFAESTRA
jgi:hypothetical protein